MITQERLHVFIADYKTWELAQQTFGKPFSWLNDILQNMTGYSHPSGYALVSNNNIIKSIWVGSTNEYALGQKIEFISSCIYIDNYEGPERSIYGWKNLSQSKLEKTFGIQFDENKINELGGFPTNLLLSS